VTYAEYKGFILSDLYRFTGDARFGSLVKQVLFGEAYKYIFWMRTCRYTRGNLFLRFLIYYPLAHRLLKRYRYKFGIVIDYATEIGPGLFIGFFGSIIVNRKAIIGKNCHISSGVTIGETNRGERKGVPVIGDGVYIGTGAKIIGSIQVGNNVAVGANCVVTRDVPDNAVIAGVPGRLISLNGAREYLHRTDYEQATG
jgi:serine O-acetyltransferase